MCCGYFVENGDSELHGIMRDSVRKKHDDLYGKARSWAWVINKRVKVKVEKTLGPKMECSVRVMLIMNPCSDRIRMDPLKLTDLCPEPGILRGRGGKRTSRST